MVRAYFCWRGGGGLVIASFPLTFGVADFCWCWVFGDLPVAGQNDRGGLPRPRRCYDGLLTGGKRLLPPSWKWGELPDLLGALIAKAEVSGETISIGVVNPWAMLHRRVHPL
ncbi:hypothetical protein NDU88_002539 [Pleurodeles waltl]|uniref:Uncharacterized protein n=1 Tax=Pleurodeles waltl TaxID=8319 RepID=A0AAV7WQZ3_PLEWA|nr:hypothetical protein NDU88_002539 [Pleurodeles waltl]